MKTRERGINIQKTSDKQYIQRENRRETERKRYRKQKIDIDILKTSERQKTREKDRCIKSKKMYQIKDIKNRIIQRFER